MRFLLKVANTLASSAQRLFFLRLDKSTLACPFCSSRNGAPWSIFDIKSCMPHAAVSVGGGLSAKIDTVAAWLGGLMHAVAGVVIAVDS